MNEILSLNPEELYNKALIYKGQQDYDNYCMYMIMSANLDYHLAKIDLENDYENERLFERQNHKNTWKFYEATQQYSYSANYLGYMYEIEDDRWQRDKAIELYELAKDNIHAINNLARLCEDTQPLKAKELYEKSIRIKVNKNAVNKLVSIYRDSDLKNDKDKVIKYFINIGCENELEEIYQYSAEYITLIKTNMILLEQNEKLLKETEELKAHIMNMPDGSLYFKAKESFYKKAEGLSN